MENLFSRRRWTKKICRSISGTELKTSTLIRDNPIRGEDQWNFFRASKGIPLPLLQDSYPDASEAINDFWFVSGNVICRHHVEPRVKLYPSKQKSFSFPLKSLTFPELQKRIWMLCVASFIIDTWTVSFSSLYSVEEIVIKRQVTSKSGCLWPEFWKGMSTLAKLTEKHKWQIENPNFDNDEKLRGIFFIVPQDNEFKKNTWNDRK